MLHISINKFMSFVCFSFQTDYRQKSGSSQMVYVALCLYYRYVTGILR